MPEDEINKKGTTGLLLELNHAWWQWKEVCQQKTWENIKLPAEQEQVPGQGK